MSHNINNSGVSHPDVNHLSNGDNINAINLTAYKSQQHQGLINAVVSVLQAPNQPTMVSKQYSNERNVATEVQAYAKISGKDWTYYVKELEVSIGRNTDNAANLNAPLPPPSSSSNGKKDITINIDLGPAKVVSRKHAVIKFNMQHGGWELLVLGRNGAKVNFKRVQAGNSAPPVMLASGTILDIGGTQMMFILPDQEPFVSQSCVNHLIPKLVTQYGNGINNTNPNDVNALLYDILRESDFIKQHRQQPSQQQVRTFKMYGNNGNGNQNNINGANQFSNGPQFMNDGSSASTGGLLLSPDTTNNNNQNMMNESYSVSNSSATHMGFPQALDFASDLSRDENRNVKPPHSYATMITQAILSTKEGVISLADIYKYISSNYAYYRFAKTGWQNSIRHNLSLNKAFEKVPRRPNEPGKGMKWRISEDYQREFLNKWNAGKIGKVRRGSSVARQLQLHLSKFNSLPAQQDYTPEPTVIKQQSMGRNRMASLDQTSQFDTPLSASSASSSLSHSNLNTLAALPQQPPQPQPQTQPIIKQSVQQQQQQQHNQYPSNAMPPPTSVSRANSNPTNNALISFTNASPAPATTAPATATSSSFQSNVAPIITTVSSSNSHLSPSRGSLLRSPTKAFHITAMEAYTPERGSAQHTRSPPISNLNVHNSTADETEAMMEDKNTESGTSNHENQNDKVSAGRSSPGVWNLLQFSSVNNTPAVNSIEKNKNLGNRNMNNATNVANMVDLEPKDVASSPLKRQDNQKNAKELMLDTEGAKISIVNE